MSLSSAQQIPIRIIFIQYIFVWNSTYLKLFTKQIPDAYLRPVYTGKEMKNEAAY